MAARVLTYLSLQIEGAVQDATGVETASLKVLVGDDQADILEALRLLLKAAGHRAVTVDSPAAVLKAAKAGDFDLILIDLNYARDTTSGQEGLDLLRRLQAETDAPPIVVMTAWGNVELAVEAMRRGACDFVQKPWDNARLLETIQKQSRRRARTEMELARHVHLRLFPQSTPQLPGLICAARCIPAREVSGDYYGVIEGPASAPGFLLADVSGKGMAAALLMANLQASFRAHAALSGQPQALLESVNRLFFEATPPEHYATLFYGCYDPCAGLLRYVNCGHVAPLVLRRDGPVQRIDATATVVGLFEKWEGEQRELPFSAGDLLVVFSDGVTEAEREPDQEYGDERLVSLVSAVGRESVDRILERIFDSVRAFGKPDQSDDMTVMVLRAVASPQT